MLANTNTQFIKNDRQLRKSPKKLIDAYFNITGNTTDSSDSSNSDDTEDPVYTTNTFSISYVPNPKPVHWVEILGLAIGVTTFGLFIIFVGI